MENEDRLEHLLKDGVITQEEYEELKARRDGTVSSKGKNVASFFLTILGIIAVLFGTCILNMGIVEGTRSKSLMSVLIVLWPLFPVVLFSWLAYKKKSKGMFLAVLFFVIIGLLIL